MATAKVNLNSQNVEVRYMKYDKRVIDFIKLIVNDLEFNYKEIPASFIANMDLLANALKIYYKACDELDQTKNVLDFTRCKNTVLQTSQYITKLINNFGASPVDKARIKRLNQEVDTSDELLEELTA